LRNNITYEIDRPVIFTNLGLLEDKNITKGHPMLRTIMLSRYIAAQGRLVEVLTDGRITIRVGEKLLQGYPVT